MKTSTVEAWAWRLLYGGLLLLVLGLFVLDVAVIPLDAALGGNLLCGGGALALAGALLIVLRSRMGP